MRNWFGKKKEEKIIASRDAMQQEMRAQCAPPEVTQHHLVQLELNTLRFEVMRLTDFTEGLIHHFNLEVIPEREMPDAPKFQFRKRKQAKQEK